MLLNFFLLALGGVGGIWLSNLVFRRSAKAIVQHWIATGEDGLEEDAVVYTNSPTPNDAVYLLRFFDQTARANAELVQTLIRKDIGPDDVDEWADSGKPNIFGKQYTSSSIQPYVRSSLEIDDLRMRRAMKHLECALEQAKGFLGNREE